VAPGRREERKSVGVERTFRDKTEDKEIMDMLTEIAEELHKDMENLQYAGKTVTVKYKLHTFESRSIYKSYLSPH
jgi:DNA polymerase kappa